MKTHRAINLPDPCCPTMLEQLRHGLYGLTYSPKFRAFQIKDRDPRSSASTLIDFCPWCGTELPERMADAWYAEIERLGLCVEDIDEKNPPAGLPPGFFTDQWWRERLT